MIKANVMLNPRGNQTSESKDVGRTKIAFPTCGGKPKRFKSIYSV
jgi:hypothetical protein